MFSATVHQVVRALGKDTLLPVNSLDVSDNIVPLSLVVKETMRHCLFWTKKKCFSTEFKLNDILDSPSTTLAVKTDRKVICNFIRKTNISLKGKFGIELSKELFDIDLEGARSVTVDSPLGDLVKEEIQLQSLLNEMNSRKINLSHPLVKPLIQEKKTLCLVTGVVQLDSDVVLSSQVQMDESGKLGGAFSCTSSVGVTADASEEVDEKKSKTLKITKGTSLVYNVYDLVISKTDGTFQIQLDRDHPGGFVSHSVAETDEVDAVAESFSGIETSGDPGSIFKGLIQLEASHRDQMKNIVRSIMEVPKTIQPLSQLLREAEMFIADKIEKTTNIDSLTQKVGSMDDDLQQFIIMAGFQIKGGSVDYPQAESDMFDVCQLLITLLEEFDDDQLEALSLCIEDDHDAQDLLQVLSKTQNTRALRVDLEDKEAAVLTTDTAKQFIDAVDLKLDGQTLVLPTDDRLTISAAYFVLYALYGE